MEYFDIFLVSFMVLPFFKFDRSNPEEKTHIGLAQHEVSKWWKAKEQSYRAKEHYNNFVVKLSS